jgi:hypothetical protein
MAHPGVLPVDQNRAAGLGAGCQDVAGKQVVVARDRVAQRQRLRDAAGKRAGVLVLAGDAGAALGHDPRVVIEQVGDPEARRQRQPRIMEGTQGARGGIGCGTQARTVDRRAVEVLGHEVALPSRDQGRGDSQLRGPLARQPLGVSVDPQQGGVASRQPQDALAVAKADPEVAVRDPAVEGHRRARGGSERLLEAAYDLPRIRHRHNLAFKAQFLYLRAMSDPVEDG